MNVPKSLTPITWKYGAIAAGVGLTHGLARIWYSPKVFGPIWSRNNPVTAVTITEKEKCQNYGVGTVADLGLAILLNYLSNRYFRPLTPTDALLFTAIIAGIQALPQFGHMMWGKQKFEEFAVYRGFEFANILIKVLCLMYIPY